MKFKLILLLTSLVVISCNQLSKEELLIHNQKVTSGILNKKTDLDKIIDNIKKERTLLAKKYKDVNSFKLLRSSSTKKAQIAVLDEKAKDLWKFQEGVQKLKKEIDIIHKTFDFQSKPENVLQKVFNAAKSQHLDMLIFLVDPYDENDSNVDNIGYLEAYPDKYKQSFYTEFKDGRIIGQPVITSNKAKIEFLFGPNANKKETMNLIKRNESWYLLSY